MFKKKSLIFVLLIIVLFGMNSCSKKDQQTTVKDENNKDVQLVNVDDKDVTESDKDLKEVDYKEVYDELSSKGEWIQVSGKDLGIDVNKGSSSGEYEFQKSIFSYITGVNDAYADADVDFGMFFVWQPSDNLAAGVTAGEPVHYVPYSNGQWVNTDAGWYFAAATPEEEIVHHYGRWAYSPGVGWVWVPGRVWAPAWVDWREEDDYIAWAPVPPEVYIVHDEFYCPPIPPERYFVVERTHFCDPQVYNYHYTFVENNVVVTNWRRPTGIFVENKIVINRGPDVKTIEKIYGRPFDVVKINHVKDIKDVKFSGREINTYTPGFKRIGHDTKIKETLSQPKSFAKYDDVKGRNKENTDRSGNDINKEKLNKNPKDNETMHGNDKGNKKLGDDREMKYGKKTRQNNDNPQQKGNEKRGTNKDKEKQGNYNKGNDKGKNKQNNDYKGNDRGKNKQGNDNKGTDKGRNKQGSDNKGSKQQGNDRKSNNNPPKNDRGNDKGNDNQNKDHGKGKK